MKNLKIKLLICAVFTVPAATFTETESYVSTVSLSNGVVIKTCYTDIPAKLLETSCGSVAEYEAISGSSSSGGVPICDAAAYYYLDGNTNSCVYCDTGSGNTWSGAPGYACTFIGDGQII